jgi:hypothetical protein
MRDKMQATKPKLSELWYPIIYLASSSLSGLWE